MSPECPDAWRVLGTSPRGRATLSRKTMKTRSLLVLAGFLFTSAGFAGEASPAATDGGPPELRGILNLGAVRQFSLSTPGGSQTGWVAVGDSFSGWDVVDFREDGDVLVLRKGSQTVEVTLSSSVIVEGEVMSTVADAKELLERIQFAEMFEKIIAQQKQAMIDKSPAMQQKLMQLTMPRIMAAMPKVREMGREFEAEQKQKAAQRTAAGQAPAGPEAVAPAPPP